MCVQIQTLCKLTHGVQNYTLVPFAYNMNKIPLTWIFYTHAVTGVTDKYEVWYYPILRHFPFNTAQTSISRT